MDTLRGTGRRWRCGAGTRLSSAPGADDPERWPVGVQSLVREATGLPCSIGIGDNKLRAKTATGFGKPAGVYRLTSENWMPVMGDRPVQALWGVGARGAARFAEHGIRTVADLASADPAELARWWGPTTGPRYRALARGEGETTIRTEPWIARSRSHQTTYPDDLTDRADDRAGAAGTGRPGGRGRRRRGTVDHSGGGDRPELVVLHREPHPHPAGADHDPVVEGAGAGRAGAVRVGRPVRLLGVRVELAPAG